MLAISFLISCVIKRKTTAIGITIDSRLFKITVEKATIINKIVLLKNKEHPDFMM